MRSHSTGAPCFRDEKPSGLRPEGPGWYTTPTLAYAEELGCEIRPVEAYLRRDTGAYLDPWHDRLKNAYLTTSERLARSADGRHA
ncbi:hypothetical protein OG272_45060 [Streptomyces sp. NBC_00104]|uniref:hypothetical protein n=1 Tax=unclassified Streptomyces TaxID=2593676 RepID=UPI00324344B2